MDIKFFLDRLLLLYKGSVSFYDVITAPLDIQLATTKLTVTIPDIYIYRYIVSNLTVLIIFIRSSVCVIIVEVYFILEIYSLYI